MTNYYVNIEHGNDGGGHDGLSHANAWLTIFKALGTIPLAGGHTLLVGDGAYQEDSGGLTYLFAQNRIFLDWLTVQPESGATGDVTITGNTSINYSIRLENCAYIRWKWIKFTSLQALTNGSTGIFTYTGNSRTRNEYIGCTFTNIASGTASFVFLNETGAGATFSHFLLEDCTIIQAGAGTVTGVRFNGTAVGCTVDDIIIRGCNITTVGVASVPVILYGGVTNILVDGGAFVSDYYGIRIGVDGQTDRTNTGIVQNANITSSAGHSLLIGAGCVGVQVLNNNITGGNYGLVVKENTGIIITGNSIQGGTVNTLYFKAAISPVASYNKVRNNVDSVVKIGYDPVNNAKCSGVNFQNNCIYATGTARCFDWGDATDDAGGGICDYNHYAPFGSNHFGTIYGSVDNLLTLGAVQTAWAGYGGGTNDSHSSLIDGIEAESFPGSISQSSFAQSMGNSL
jgi:hypothetical protein